MPTIADLIDNLTGRILVPEIHIARSFSERLIGLMGKASIPAERGMWFEHCGSIQTTFMRFPIDVIFFDKNMTIQRIACEVAPWRMAACSGASHTLELNAGQASRIGLQPGMSTTLRLKTRYRFED